MSDQSPNSTAEDTAKSENSKKPNTKARRQRRKKAKATLPNVSTSNSNTNSSKSTSSKSTVALPIPSSQSLSAEGIALLKGLRKNTPAKKAAPRSVTPPPVRTGHVSVQELMGGEFGNSPEDTNLVNILNKLRLGGTSHLTKSTVLNAALAQMPPVPGFPSLLAAHRPDHGPSSTSFRPELFKTTMEAFASSAAKHGNGGGNVLGDLSALMNSACFPHMGFDFRGATQSRSSHNTGSSSPLPQLVPWFRQQRDPLENPSSPSQFRMSSPVHAQASTSNATNRGGHFPKGSGTSGGFRSPGGPSGNRPSPQLSQSGFRAQGSTSHAWPSQSSANHNNQQNGSNQKTRKPYFMPYTSQEAVERGLRNGDLFQGILRVNQRNYEESYVDNPDGNDQLDILILGVHDRNRALHGDFVVVKIKERGQWVVRDNLYQAWRAGNLSAFKDDNGQPILAPGEKKGKEEEDSESMPVVSVGGVSLSHSELELPVPVNKKGKYPRKEMIQIGAQMELLSQKASAAGTTSALALDSDIQTLVENLAIAKTCDDLQANASPLKKLNTANSGTSKRSTNQAAHRRSSYRLLNEIADDDSEVPDACLQKTAEVVFISHTKNCRTAMGQLKVMADGNRNWALFSPTDSRMPRMMIPSDQLPLGFFDRPQDYQKFLFVAKMVEWQATAQFARGKLERTLGLAGDIEAETEGLLYSNDVDTKEFSSSALSSLPISEASEWKIDEKEFKYRRDLREEIIFTIDPLTARDLDDALSIKPCADIDGRGTPGWEVGVHIADVTHFLIEQSELDQWAASRATSVYLVHKVVPMLPRILCEELCSLNPAVDRLCFSVVWKMNNDAEIMDEWFGRTVIRSCCKMAYEHAQDMIENPDKVFTAEELPSISDGRTPAELKAKVLQLDEIAKKLRDKRMRDGALRLDQPKLKFSLDDDTKMPNGVAVYEIKDSNKLVEEYMLLANMAVARKIEGHFTKISLLRRHPPPKQKVLREVLELCDKIGFPVDASTSGVLSSSLRRFASDNEVKAAINQVLSMLMMRPMQLAVYFCSGSVKSKSEYHHYALSAPFYTHFTSPIRRYPDIMVHRLLSAALGYTPIPKMDQIDQISKQAQHCNDKKLAAKTVSEASADTFFGLFVKQCGPFDERGVVVNVLDASFDVLVFKYGVVKRVYVNRLDMARDPVFSEGPPPRLTLFWKGTGGSNVPVEQVIQMCTVVDVVLSALPEPTKYQAVIKKRSKSESKTLSELYAEDAKTLSSFVLNNSVDEEA